MKAEELMLGDWVYSFTHEKCKVCEINAIGTHTVELDSYDNDDGGFILDCEPTGIPITSEILVKNGFVLESEGWVYYKNPKLKEQDYICISFRHNGETRSVEINFMHKAQCVFRHIYVVHELQHAFRLCGITKEIEL